MDLWIWAIVLVVIGLALGLTELFIPSGGLIGFLSFCALLGAVILAFVEDPVIGLLVLAVSIIGLPTILVLGLRWWPHTPVGKKALLSVPDRDEVLPDDPKRRNLKNLVGRVGRAKSKMLLSGAVVIDGRTIDAVSDGLPIEPGQAVQVVAVHGVEVIVRPVDEPTAHQKTQPSDDLLARPIDSVIPDAFGEPPA